MAGSSGGGGSSSAVPNYLRNVHSGLLADVVDELPTVFVDNSMVEVLNETLKNNPYTNRHPYNPVTNISEMDTLIRLYRTWCETLSVKDYSELTDVHTTEAIDDLEDNVIPRFAAQYRDEGAVYSSTYYAAIAKLYMEVSKNTEKLRANLRLEAQKTQASVQADMFRLWLETIRMKQVMRDEEAKQDTAYREHEAKWRIECFMPVGNFISAVSGGTVPLQPKQPSAFSSALGGALSGASTGMALSAMPGMQPFAPALVGGGAALGLLGGLFK